MKTRSLRRLLAAVSLSSILAVWALSVAVIFFQQRAAGAEAVAGNDRLSLLVTDLLSYYFRERFSSIELLAGFDMAPSGGGLGAIERFYASFPFYESIVILDSSGKILKSVPASLMMEGFDFSARSFFQEARAGEVTLSEVYTSLATGHSIITGSIRAGDYIIAANLDIGSLADSIGKINPSEYSHLALLDRDGRYVYNRDMSYVLHKKIDFRYNELFGDRRPVGLVHYRETIDGKRMDVTASVVGSTGWTVLVYYDYASETRKTLEYLQVSLALLALVLLASLYFSARSISQVARVLTGFIEKTDLVARGDYSVSLGSVAFSEFRQLSDNFAAMTRSVMAREEELRRAEDGLRVLNASLESKVEERTTELAEANEGLRRANSEIGDALRALRDTQSQLVMAEKMTALGRISAGVAHELNTPLAAIVSNLRVIMRSLGQDLVATMGAFAAIGPGTRALVARATSGAAAAGTEGELSDPAEQRRRRERAMATLREAGVAYPFACADTLVALGVDGLAAELGPALAGGEGESCLRALRGIVLPVQAARIASLAVGQAAQVTGALKTYFLGGSSEDAGEIALAAQLSQVLALFRNRLGRGIGVSVDVEEDLTVWGKAEELGRIWFNILSNAIQAVGDSGSIAIRAEPCEGRVEVHVVDSGHGIPEAIRHLIFTPFFTTRPLGEGSGLGLDTARRLARANGGDIGFTCGEGGTDFVVTLAGSRPVPA